ncbi:MAG: hypothetical protein ACLQRH_20300 [Acidimicrobiales bacterium]
MRQSGTLRIALRVATIAGLIGALSTGVLEGTAGATSHGSTPIARAKKALLVLSDMPKGWTSAKSSSNTNTPFPGAAQLASCIGVPTSVITYNAPSVSSPEFDSKNQQLSAQDSVQVYPSPKAAQADFASLANPKTPGCMTSDLNGSGKAAFDAQVGGGLNVGSVTVTRTPQSYYAARTTNFTMFFPVTQKGVTVNVELTLIDYVKGNEEQTVMLSAFQATFPIALARHLTTVADGRI